MGMIARWRMAARFAWRDLRGGLGNFRVFLLALALGVAGLAAVGSLVSGLRAGLETRGAELLGGDIEVEFANRYAEPEEIEAMRGFGRVSETLDMRSNARVLDESGVRDAAVIQLKAVDDNYPLIGEVVLDPPMILADALAADADGRFGAVAERALMTRLDLEVGDTVRWGELEFELRAELVREPDRAVSGLTFGPRLMLSTEAVSPAGMAVDGTIFETEYRVLLPEGVDVREARTALQEALPGRGQRISDKRNGAPGVERGVGQIGGFLTLVGLAALAVGGVGVGGSVRAYLDKKTEAIATLKTLGSDGATVMRVYLIQIAILTALGVFIGLALGAGLVLVLAPIFADRFPVEAEIGLYAAPLLEAALYGALTAFLFSLWPLARAKEIRAAGLFRDSVSPTAALPRPAYIVATGAIALLLAGAAVYFAENRWLAQGFVGGVAAIFLVLMAAAAGVSALARRLARGRLGRVGPAFRLALSSLGGSRSETRSAVLALGLGLTTLTAIGLVDANLRRFVTEQLPTSAADYFVLDIVKEDGDRFREEIGGLDGVAQIDMLPMMRGFITDLDGVPVEEWIEARNLEGRDVPWPLRGDRAASYSAEPPENHSVVAGEWFAPDHQGEPVLSFGAEQAALLELDVGDTVTVNLLGRSISGRIVALHDVDFRRGGIQMIMIFNPAALGAAPHTYLATVYGQESVGGDYLRAIANGFPSATAVPTKEIIERLASAVTDIADAARYGALATLLTGLVVLAGAAAAGQQARIYESSIMKTMGAERGALISALTFRSALMGLAAGLVALVAGTIAAWAVVTFVFFETFVFDLGVALTILGFGLAATLLAGAAFAYGPLSARPARVLRARA